MRDVIRHLIKILETGGEAIVCQVVETRGSTPQKAGSMMIVDPDGGQGGTLGGGCVENEVKTKAMQQISSGAAGGSLVRARPRLRLGRRLDLRRADGGDHSAGARAGAARVFPYDRQVSRGWRRLHRGGRARPGSSGRASRRQALSLRRRWLPEGQPAVGRRSRGACVADRKAGHSAQTVGPERDCVPAELAAHPADRRGCGPRRTGRRRARGAEPTSTSGSSTTATSTPIASDFRPRSAFWLAHSITCSRASKSRR